MRSSCAPALRIETAEPKLHLIVYLPDSDRHLSLLVGLCFCDGVKKKEREVGCVGVWETTS